MAHPTKALCAAMVAYLNGGSRPWSGDFTAIYQPIPAIATDPNGAEKLATWRVVVSPSAWTGELASRSGAYDDTHTISIGFIRKMPAGVDWKSSAGATQIDTWLDAVAEVIDDLRANAITLGTFAGGQYTHDIMVSPTDMAERNTFVSVVRGEFRDLT